MSDIKYEVFTHCQHCDMAWLIWKRWNKQTNSAAAAWRRLMQNSCTEDQFFELVKGSLLSRIYAIVNSNGEFWSNSMGWVDQTDADVFSKEETECLDLPIDGKWIFVGPLELLK